MTPARVKYLAMVNPWLSWAVFALARKVTADVELCMSTAHRACVELWDR